MEFGYDWESLDRLSTHRSKPELIEELLNSEDTSFIAFNDLKFFVTTNESPNGSTLSVAWLTAFQVQPFLFPSNNAIKAQTVFLGQNENNQKKSYFAIDVTNFADSFASQSPEKYFVESRPGLFQLSSFDASIVSCGKSLLDWNARNVKSFAFIKFCAACGTATTSTEAGWKRACSKTDCISNKGVQNISYPRTDPVVIACISSKDGEKCLLGRQKRFPPNWYSCIAGFMEPAETIEVFF
ncbi:Peroxisomal NADH pyrophosphatase nudt12 [Nowakowskiella sp. JEL0078]|nr:Peroxisomal NADH pyrophosphatase nudt12 [Nowakowskiella sp. JEL0078]